MVAAHVPQLDDSQWVDAFKGLRRNTRERGRRSGMEGDERETYAVAGKNQEFVNVRLDDGLGGVGVAGHKILHVRRHLTHA